MIACVNLSEIRDGMCNDISSKVIIKEKGKTLFANEPAESIREGTNGYAPSSN